MCRTYARKLILIPLLVELFGVADFFRELFYRSVFLD